ncbi:MAG: A/G-specific adenine glycosylase [Candidatus Paceibacterota bacterium]
MQKKEFQNKIWAYYHTHKRTLPWRQTRDPYKILVSEIMLQQTQAPRVIPKYKTFIKEFPDAEALAHAPLKKVLTLWQGLGYNRRAIYLKRCAEIIVRDHKGKFPKDVKTLLSLPGIGQATAGDILAFAFNIPTVVIETNIRTVFLYQFFKEKDKVSDTEIIPLIKATLDMQNPREWYWALFDYGAHLKETHKINHKSTHYKKQSSFRGSHREKRATLLRAILSGKHSKDTLTQLLSYDLKLVDKITRELTQEGFICVNRAGIFRAK